MATEVEYALMAGRVYQSTRGKINWLPDLQSWGWTEQQLQQQPSGFEAVSFQKGNEIVISFAGTGSNVDWWANAGGFFGVTTEQLRQAADYYLQVKATHPGAIIHLTGHSLGGGLASLMAVFFDETAVTFDQAPFRNSASGSVATSLKDYLLNERGYSQAALQGLTNFISAAASGGVPHNNNVIDFSVQGEILSAASGLRIGTQTSWTHGVPDLIPIDLHSHALLTAFLQSDRTAPAQQSLSDVTFKLPDVVRMIFDSNLYKFSTGTQNTQNKNFIEHLVHHQNGIAGLTVGETVIPADAMLTRFTSDLWKLAQDGGLTMADGPTPATNLVSKTLIAFAMQKYYDETQASAGYNQELFTDVTGGVHFDRADVAATLGDAKGYNDFHFYLVNNFSAADRQRIEDLLPVLRDWYVQAGAGGMNATDIQNRGAFMLGGYRTDTLIGGSQTDLLVGNVGGDKLTGGGGDDTLLGGTGFDTYYYTTGDGHDRIEDSDAEGVIFVNGQMLVGGVKKVGQTYWESADGTIKYEMSGTDLVVKLNGTQILTVNENFESGQFGINLIDRSSAPRNTGVPTGPFRMVWTGTAQPESLGDPTLSPHAGDAVFGFEGGDFLYGDGFGNDLLDGGEGDDFLYGYNGDDYLDGGMGNDYLDASDSVNIATIHDGYDILIGGAGDDVLYAGGVIEDIGELDYLDGGDGADYLWAGRGMDVLLGGVGNDILLGDNRPSGGPIPFNNSGSMILVPGPAIFSVTGGDDSLDGGDGNDILVGDGGDDVLLGGDDNDELWGDDQQVAVVQEGNDWLDGGAGNDQLVGGGGQDTLAGGDGDDLLAGDYANNSTDGFDDILDGGAGIDELQGGGGHDLLTGGTENDRLFGQDGNDSLFGDTGDDLLTGGLGNDELDGGEGIDDMQGREGDDLLLGGGGSDFLYGDGPDPTVLNLVGGNDSLDGEEGDDLLWGGGGQDQLFGGDGADQLVGDNGNDHLYGEAGNDLLVGDSTLFPAQAGTDLLDGGDGNDVLQGGGGDDELEGGDGADVIFGEFDNVLGAPAGNDDLHGGLGNDRLVGGGGLDTYRFNLGDGRDSIEDNAVQSNRVVFGAGITAEDLSLDVATGDSLLVRVGNNGDALEIVGFGISLPTDFHSIRQFEFADGTILSDSQLLARGFHLSAPVTGGTVLGTAYADHIEGSQVDDWIHGRDGNDILNGGQGNDVLEGEEGDDELNGGSGNDRLYGSAGSNVLRGGEGDDLLDSAGVGDQLFGGIGDDGYHLRSGSQTLNEELNAGTDTIYLTPAGSLTFYTPDNVENVRIEDDVFLDPVLQVNMVGNALDNVLSGSHRLDGQAGNDTLIGLGDNTFVFGRGYGHDIVQAGTQWYAHTGLDQVEFVADIAPADLVLENHANDLVVKVNGTTDQLTVQSYFVSPSATVDQFVFAGGTVWGLTEIESRVQTFVGSEADETFYGTVNDDTISGLGGNDQIRASSGNDTLDGGTGNDFLEGWSGNDTYVFGLGYGQDSIDEQGDSADVDTLRLEGINPGDITLRATPDFMTDAILTINNTADQLTLAGFFAFDSLRVDRFQFADGTVWDYNAMLAHTEGVTLDGTEDADFLYGNVTNDMLAGFGGDDSLNGGAGNDTLDGGSGVDTMAGGTGNDVYVVDDPGDVVTEQASQGTDTVQAAITYTLGANLEHLTLIGTAAINGTGNARNNTLTGNSAANVLTGGTGNDTYVVGIGDTVVEQASSGTDTIQSSVSWTLGTNVENLTLTGTSAINGTGNTLNNSLIGNTGSNILDGSSGTDAMSGGAGDDIYVVDNTADTVTENASAGIDTVQSSVTYTLGANVDNLTLTGTAAINGTGNGLNNVLTGNSVANVLNGGTGADTMNGGAGNDTYVVDNPGDVVTEAPGGGTDLVQSSITYALAAEVENLTLTGILAINGTGNTLNNSLTGNTGNNILDGGAGADAMSGGTGNDTYVVDNTGDTVTEAASAGTDTVQSSVTFTLGSNIEKLTLTGTAAINGTGNTLNNTLIGNSGANTLNGGAGTDAMSGGAGNDTYVVDNAGDTVTENTTEGIDTVQSSLTHTLAVNVENLTLTGTTAINGTGNALDNVFTGNSGANVLTGGAGNDTYVVGTGDSIVENAGAGIDTVQSSIAWTLGANLENLTLTGTGAINGTGNTLDNVLTGNSGANVLTGGAGNDTYVVGTGDSVVENTSAGTDTVQSSITWTLGANLENLTLTGSAVINGTGNVSNNALGGNSANNTLSGLGGNDTYLYSRGSGQDTVIDNAGTADSVLFGATINPLDLVLSRQANDLRLAIHGSTDQVTIQNWYGGATNQTETIQAGNGQTLLNTEVDQLIQAMATFSQQTGLTWDQALDQRPQEVQTVLAANWH